jgi:hypothetical protein
MVFILEKFSINTICTNKIRSLRKIPNLGLHIAKFQRSYSTYVVRFVACMARLRLRFASPLRGA